ncbi:terminase small subunit [Pseudomonas protegens]|uniref:terminase small subunit n=1 Tax=Pseudomonas protegens TaxID=380021 RepID=UPI002764102B|nr:terminase small subunit [Pseudomonas protegens]MDP9518809.1 terminase small subunit [Pseudomonas protegens]
MALTAKQQAFVAEYLLDLNATQAAIRAGYAKRGAKDQAWQNMQNPEILAAIKAAMEARNKRTHVPVWRRLQLPPGFVRKLMQSVAVFVGMRPSSRRPDRRVAATQRVVLRQDDRIRLGQCVLFSAQPRVPKLGS